MAKTNKFIKEEPTKLRARRAFKNTLKVPKKIEDTEPANDAKEVTTKRYGTGVKKVFAYNLDTKIFMGETIARESPLEPGVFHLPAGTTEVEPPAYKKGKITVMGKKGWEQIDEPKQEEPKKPEPVDPALEARNKRTILLYESDYTQLVDVYAGMTEENKTAWIKYRQALRDVTNQKGFPEKIEWPTKPSN